MLGSGESDFAAGPSHPTRRRRGRITETCGEEESTAWAEAPKSIKITASQESDGKGKEPLRAIRRKAAQKAINYGYEEEEDYNIGLENEEEEDDDDDEEEVYEKDEIISQVEPSSSSEESEASKSLDEEEEQKQEQEEEEEKKPTKSTRSRAKKATPVAKKTTKATKTATNSKAKAAKEKAPARKRGATAVSIAASTAASTKKKEMPVNQPSSISYDSAKIKLLGKKVEPVKLSTPIGGPQIRVGLSKRVRTGPISPVKIPPSINSK